VTIELLLGVGIVIVLGASQCSYPLDSALRQILSKIVQPLVTICDDRGISAGRSNSLTNLPKMALELILDTRRFALSHPG